jgi:multiple antibiotic resistance protein
MEDLTHFWLLAFSSFFALINPIGVMPVYLSLTAELSGKERFAVATKSVIVAFFVIMLFALSGQFLFRFFGISIHSLRIVGGIVFFLIGMDLLQARLSKVDIKDEELKRKHLTDIAISPLAIPILCGPGAITNAIILMEDAVSYHHQVTLLVAILSVLFITYISLLAAGRIVNYMGDTLNTVLMRLMGLIVMVIAVEFFFAGLRPMLSQ